MKSSTLFSLAALLVTIVACFHCVVPTDPALDPENAEAGFVVANGGSLYVNQGESRKIGLYLSYPRHFEKITITSSRGVLDTVVIFDKEKTYDTMYFSPVFNISGECVVTATAIFQNKEFKEKTTRLEFYVKAGASDVEFVLVPTLTKTHTGNSDTLLFVSKNKGNEAAKVHTVASVPPIDPTQLYLLNAASNDTARVVFNPAAADSYTVSVTAQVSAATPIKATATVGIRVFGDITPSKIDAPQNIIAGTADTLRFAVDNKTRTDKLTIKLVTEKPLDPAIFKILPSGTDSVVIAIAATTTSTPGTTKIGIATNNGIITDTAWYPVTFTDKESVLWYNTELALPATEGIPLRYDLKPLFIKPQNGTVTFSADLGTVTQDTFWQYTPAYGSAETVKAVVTAQKGNASLGLTMVITVIPGDTAAPVVSLADPALSGRKVSSSQITVNCIAIDKEAGVATVVYSCAGKTAVAAPQADNIWSGVVTGLENGKATEITITATDRSMKKNSSSIKFTVTYDSTTPGVAPVITTQPPATAQVIEGETLTLEVAASGTPTPSYQWYKNNEPQAGQTNAEYKKPGVTASDSGSYSVTVSNGIGTGVTSSKTVVTIRLKAQITQDPIATTVNEGGTASFTVKAVGEAPLSYQWLKDGKSLGGATTETCTINQATTDDNNAKFSCKVTNAFSEAVSGSAALTVTALPEYKVIFNTDGGSTVAPQQIKEGGKATEPSPKPTKTGYEFEGWYISSSQFDFSKVITADIALTAKWTQLFTLTYSVNGGTGTVPQAKQYKSGATAKVEGTAGLSKGQCTCIGWGDGTNTYNQGAVITITRDTTLWAVWQATVTFKVGTTTYKQQTVISGKSLGSANFPANPTKTDGSTFLKWTTDAGGLNQFTQSTTVTDNITVYAQWEAPVDCSVVPAKQGWDVINICSGAANILEVTSPNCSGVQKNYTWHIGLEGSGSPLTDTYDNGEGGYYYGQGTSKLNVRLGGIFTEFFCVVTFANGQKDTTAFWRVATCP